MMYFLLVFADQAHENIIQTKTSFKQKHVVLMNKKLIRSMCGHLKSVLIFPIPTTPSTLSSCLAPLCTVNCRFQHFGRQPLSQITFPSRESHLKDTFKT